MMTKSSLLFLGTGGSMGIPVMGCSCTVCSSDNPLNKRLRPSALVTIENRHFLIDAGPDLRTQALNHAVKRLDGVLITHAHNDHVAGIDELRLFYKYLQKPLPLLLSGETYRDLSIRYNYIFAPRENAPSLLPKFDIQLLTFDRGQVDFVGLPVGYVSYHQAGMRVNGFRFGSLAYITDIRDYSETLYQELQGVEILVITAIRLTPSPLHFSVDEAIAFADRIGAKQTWLSHIGHHLEHEKITAYLPSHVRLAYDGLKIEFNYA